MSFAPDARVIVARSLKHNTDRENNVASLFTLRMRLNVLRQRRQACYVVDRKVPNASLKKQRTKRFMQQLLMLCSYFVTVIKLLFSAIRYRVFLSIYLEPNVICLLEK